MSEAREYIIRGKRVSRFDIDVLACAAGLVSNATGASEDSDEDVAYCLEALNARLEDWDATALSMQQDYDDAVWVLITEAFNVHSVGRRSYLKCSPDGKVESWVEDPEG